MISKGLIFINKSFVNLRLRKKLILSHSLITVFILLLFSGLTYKRTSEFIQEQVIFSAQKNYEQTYSFITYKLNRIMKISDVVLLNNEINRILVPKVHEDELANQMQDMNDLSRILRSFEDETDILKVKIYVRKKFIYSNEKINLFQMEEVKDTLWYKRLIEKPEKAVWCPPSYLEQGNLNDGTILSVTRRIPYLQNYRENLALLAVEFEEMKIRDILVNANSIKNSLTFIINKEGTPVSVSDWELYKRYDVNRMIEEGVLWDNNGWENLMFANQQIYLRSKVIEQTDWYMVTVSPIGEIILESNSIKSVTLILLIISGLFAYFLAWLLSYSITKKLSIVVHKMKTVQAGNFELIGNEYTKNEVGELIESYNFMINKISKLMEEQYKSGQELKSSELKALQSQINPHFLYNTLELINWLAQEGMVSEIENVVLSLSRFYKFSLNKGKDIICIKDELTHVYSYIEIQKIRFKSNIQLVINVNEEVKQYAILKITLQPIVENALLHGILEKPKKSGIISITGFIMDNQITLTITDDGVGMTPEVLERFFEGGSSSTKGSGYAIKNVDRRIKIFYGDEYGLSVESTYGLGTTVTLRIPAVKFDD